MTEEMLFAAALEKETPAERAAFLDEACSGDVALHRRVEALLQSHAHADFLKSPAVNRPAEQVAGQACAEDTQGELPADDGGVEALDFLAPSDKPGALGRLGHYEILEVIGRGGMGIVLRAFDEKLHRVVAIKVMAAQLATNANARRRFTREAQAAAAVTHDHLVTIHAVEEGNGLPYLVMQFVSGMSLQQRLDRDGPLQLTEIVRIGLQTAGGLAAAHAHGLIHRDIKPANILLENGVERVRITDFGLARAVADASLTQSGVVAGTPQYMSPEQARGEAVDQRTDLFSLGSVLYAMCAGRPPFRAASSMAVLKRICDETPSSIRETNPEIPDWLVALIDKLHAKDPAGRFRTAAEVADLLNQHLAHLQHPSIMPRPAPIPKPITMPVRRGWRSRKVSLAVGIILAVALVALGVLVVSSLSRIDRSLEKEPSEPGSQGDWVQLFNGKDLSGWKYHPKTPGNWTVKDGILTSGGPANYLYTEKGDFSHFHLRAEVRTNDLTGAGAIILRSPYGSLWTDVAGQPGWNGYAAQISGYPPGTLHIHTDKSQTVLAPEGLVQERQWFTLEVIAQGATMMTKINGTTTATLVHSTPEYAKGHIALQQLTATKFEFRKIEIKELPPAVTSAKTVPHPFVVLGGKGVAQSKFDSLADAVQGASDGDTIEVRGNGPFVTEPITVGTRVLTLRSGTGFRPVIRLSPQASQGFEPMLSAMGDVLVLEGLELQRLGQKGWSPGHRFPSIVHTSTAALHVANCRFRLATENQVGYCLFSDAAVCVVRNCAFVCPDSDLASSVDGGACPTLRVLENCVHIGGHALGLWYGRSRGGHDMLARLSRNTLVSSRHVTSLNLVQPLTELEQKGTVRPIRVEASGNVFGGRQLLLFLQHSEHFGKGRSPNPADADATLLRLLAWHDRGNLYRPGARRVFWCVSSQLPQAEFPLSGKAPADWARLWKDPEATASEGEIRYRGGDLLGKLARTPEDLTPEDFRLRPDSAGYRAGKDGKDLGADVDLVGPGSAYERWKKTPEYQQWLKETKQVTKAQAPTPESKAFVVLTGKGVEVRRYDTLAEAVRGASDGDTIEIRGNGPFVTEPIDIKNQSLIIRAADGFRPVLKLTAEAVEKGLPLLETSAPLVLEGLELQKVSQTIRAAGGLHGMLFSHEAPLWLANCRFFMKDQDQMCVQATYCPTVGLHNCEFFTNGLGLHLLVDKSSKCLVSNCVQAGGNTLGVNSHRPGAREALVRLEGNTWASSTWLVGLSVGGSFSPKHWELAPEHKLVRIKAADNILDAKSALNFSQYPETPPQERWRGIKGPEVETAFRNLIHWDDGRNVFAPGASSISWLISGASEPPHGPKGLATWKRFWGNLNADALEGQVRYQGGNLSGLLASGPEKLTAEHFRLRPDSAGYRAGKNGKDLGADIELVGPGPAYERWRKTPAYQQWLKDSGQVKK